MVIKIKLWFNEKVKGVRRQQFALLSCSVVKQAMQTAVSLAMDYAGIPA